MTDSQRIKEETQLGFYRDRLTDPQRRRLEALVFVRYAFPNLLGGATQKEMAQWIISGRWPE